MKGLVGMVAVAAAIASAANAAVAAEIDVWIGTGNDPASEGLYHTSMDTERGLLEPPTLATDAISAPGFLAAHPSLPVVYAVGDVEQRPSVAAFRIVGPGRLELLNAVATGDGTAAHVGIHPGGGMLATAQYGGGSVATFRLNDDGSIDRRTGLIEHDRPSRSNSQRQMEPHPHCVEFSPDGSLAAVADLGEDRVAMYRVREESDTFNLLTHIDLFAGDGPRHVKFSADGGLLYVLNELSLRVVAFDIRDLESEEVQIRFIGELIDGKARASERFVSASEIRLHPNGRFGYAAVRGADVLVAFQFAPAGLGRKVVADPAVNVVEVENARAVTPRNFDLTPDGRWLLSAGQDSHTLAVFDVHPITGKLTYQRQIIRVPNPICVLPLERR